MISRLIAGIAAVAILVGTQLPAQAAPIAFYATLSGAAEAPPNGSPGTGDVTVVFDTVAHTMRVIAEFAGLTGASTVAHIHCCTATPSTGTAAVATATPTFPGFPAGVLAGTYDVTFDMTLASSYRAGFITDSGGTTAFAEQRLFNETVAGRSYFNLHSSAFPGGELRGFLVPEPATLALLGLGLAGLAVARRRRR